VPTHLGPRLLDSLFASSLQRSHIVVAVKIGTHGRGLTLNEIAANAEADQDAGYSSVWFSDGIGMDPLTLIAALAQRIGSIELGTAVVRTLPRHPMILAQQALTANALTGGRLTLGIGPSHRPAVESSWGMSFDNPIAKMRDYLSVLCPLLAGQSVDYDGQYYSAHGDLRIEGGPGLSVLVAALGPQMLRLSGRLADGTVTVMAGPRTLTSHICPVIREAAERAGRPEPRVVSTLSVCVTDDIAAARVRAERGARTMASMPSYAALLEREGGPALLAGSEEDLDEALARLEDAGVTEVLPLSIARRGTKDDARTSAWISRQLDQG
jgi:5,10-methylenetetrahydromethanopterin reductase